MTRRVMAKCNILNVIYCIRASASADPERETIGFYYVNYSKLLINKINNFIASRYICTGRKKKNGHSPWVYVHQLSTTLYCKYYVNAKL